MSPLAPDHADRLLATALLYSIRGWRVFPCHDVADDHGCTCRRPGCGSPAKHPRIRAWQNEATTDESRIRRWWSTWPTANVAIATGEGSGLVVLDVDPRHGGEESIESLAIDELWATPLVRTGGGGTHYYFAHPGVRILNKVGLFPGIDIRGDGGFVVAPPSTHISSEVYEWIRPPR